MLMLDLYRNRYGDAAKKWSDSWNGPCPLCSSGERNSRGERSDRFVIWPDRMEKTGKVCAENNIPGYWWCRQCGSHGDTIAYMIEIEGMDFKQALAELGIKGQKQQWRRYDSGCARRMENAFSNLGSPETGIFAPSQSGTPSETWIAYAEKLVAEGEKAIWDSPRALNWLAARGIDGDAVKKYRLGYLAAENVQYRGRWRARAALGLAPREKEDGRVQKNIFIPRGILIPTFAGGRPVNLRIRRHDSDLDGGRAKYHELEGGSHAPYFLPCHNQGALVYAVVEAELDAVLLQSASGGICGALAVRTNRGKPDLAAHRALTGAYKIFVALDSDEAGEAGVPFWLKTYPQAKRLPIPQGKDPGDAYKAGADIRGWLKSACDYAVSHENAGQTDACPAGLNVLGRGEEKQAQAGANWLMAQENGKNDAAQAEDVKIENSASSGPCDGFTENERGRLLAALPQGRRLEDYAPDVLRARLIWQGNPSWFENRADGGFGWKLDYQWRASHERQFEDLWRIWAESSVFRHYLVGHPAARVDWKNLLMGK